MFQLHKQASAKLGLAFSLFISISTTGIAKTLLEVV